MLDREGGVLQEKPADKASHWCRDRALKQEP